MTVRILLVEDDFLIRTMLAECLQDAGFEVAEAGDFAAAVANATETPPAVLLTDLQLGVGGGGAGLAAALQARDPALAVVFLTGRPDAAPAAGPRHAVIGKPYTPREVIAVIGRLLSTVADPAGSDAEPAGS